MLIRLMSTSSRNSDNYFVSSKAIIFPILDGIVPVKAVVPSINIPLAFSTERLQVLSGKLPEQILNGNQVS